MRSRPRTWNGSFRVHSSHSAAQATPPLRAWLVSTGIPAFVAIVAFSAAVALLSSVFNSSSDSSSRAISAASLVPLQRVTALADGALGSQRAETGMMAELGAVASLPEEQTPETPWGAPADSAAVLRPTGSPIPPAHEAENVSTNAPASEIEPAAPPAVIFQFVPETPTASPAASRGVRYHPLNGRAIRPVGTMRMVVTAYSPDSRSCGRWADGKTASGKPVRTNGGKLVAADTRLLPFGAIISIPGYHGGEPVPVLDRGGAIKGHRLDVLYPTHQVARQWGVQTLDITVWGYVDSQ